MRDKFYKIGKSAEVASGYLGDAAISSYVDKNFSLSLAPLNLIYFPELRGLNSFRECLIA